MLYPKDSRIRVIRQEKTLKIEWNWDPNGGIVFLIFGLALIVAFGFAGNTIRTSGDPADFAPVIRSLLLGLAFGAPIMYAGLAYRLNKTTIHVDHERLIVRSGPVPWRKPVLMPCGNAIQFFIAMNTSNTSPFALHTIDQESYQRQLVSAFPGRIAAYQVCHELQDWFGLEDLPVFGHNTLPSQPGPRKK